MDKQEKRLTLEREIENVLREWIWINDSGLPFDIIRGDCTPQIAHDIADAIDAVNTITDYLDKED